MNNNEWVYVLRIVIASMCGLVIGLERENRLKDAGIRTHCLVACGAALMMVLSKYCFFDLPDHLTGVRGADPARIAAQVVSGIGFLGAGMIFTHKENIIGLTTAAGIWTTAGIGMAIGAGLYVTGIAITCVVITVQLFLHINIGHAATTKTVLSIENVDKQSYQSLLTDEMRKIGISARCAAVRRNSDNTKNYKFILELPESVKEEDVLSKIEYEAKITSDI